MGPMVIAGHDYPQYQLLDKGTGTGCAEMIRSPSGSYCHFMLFVAL